MRIITRYILAELCKQFLLSLVIVTGLILIFGVVREAVGQHLPPTQVVRLIPFILPDALRIAVPVTLLLAATSVYSRMAGSNEVVAIKSMGIFPMAIFWPALLLAFLLSLATVILNDVAVSWGRDGVRRVIIEAGDDIAYGMLRTQGNYSTQRFDISVRRVVDRRLIGPTLSLREHGGTPAMTITAEEAVLRCDRRENLLKISIRNGTVEVEDRVTFQFPEWKEYVIPLWDESQAVTSPSSLPLRVIPDEIRDQKAAIKRYEQELAAQAAFEMIAGDFDSLTSREWESCQHDLASMRSRLARLRTEPHRRWSAGFTCLCFVFVGGPMAMWLRNRDFLTSFFLCFLPILIIYYPLLASGVDAAKCGRLHPSIVWAGNGLLVLLGCILLRKVLRY